MIKRKLKNFWLWLKWQVTTNKYWENDVNLLNIDDKTYKKLLNQLFEQNELGVCAVRSEKIKNSIYLLEFVIRPRIYIIYNYIRN